jgi:hypothetical protein
MIPTIPDLLMGLLRGDYTAAQCEAWINRHIELGADDEGLRDHFAALALPACITACVNDTGRHEDYPTHVAFKAYEIADAMLRVRSAS